MKRSKKYQSALSNIDKAKKYSPTDALNLMPKLSLTKFVGSISIQLFLNLNEKQKKDSIRGSYTLPNTFGKSLKVLAVVDKSEIEKAKDADIVGGEEIFKDIEAGKLEFDLVITTPMMMGKLARLGKTLGSKGLMPNPKNGTITTNLSESIKKFKQGMKNFKSVNGAPITAVIGKSDMTTEQLQGNLDAFVKAVINETKKYSSTPIKRAILTTTMGPKVELDASYLV